MPFIIKKEIEQQTSVLSEEHCIAKINDDATTGMSVETHCRLVAYMMMHLREALPSYLKHRLPKKLYVLGALHDIGKISPSFLIHIWKEKMEAINKELYGMRDIFKHEYRHEFISEAYFLRKYGYKGKIAKEYAKIIGWHHAKRNGSPLNEDHVLYGGQSWLELREKIFKSITEEFGDPCFTPITQEESKLISGFLVEADWLTSKYFDNSGNLGNMNIDLEIKSIIKELGWKHAIPKKGLSFSDIFSSPNKKFIPHRVQEVFLDIITKRGVYIIEDATGSGKSELAFMGAYNLISKKMNNGIYFALPTRATSDAMFLRFKNFLEKAFEQGNKLCLVHGQSFISELDNQNSVLSPRHKWFLPNRHALLLPFCVGTIDQILKSVVYSKFNFVRTLGLANKVIILDELHSYGVYTGQITDILINELLALDCSIIILSATLTRERKEQILGKYSCKMLKNIH